VNNAEGISELSVYVNDSVFAQNLPISAQTITIPTTTNSKVGPTTVIIKYKNGKGEIAQESRKVIFFSDLTPIERQAEIVKTFAHAKTSYTQGLEFYKGKLFEGTGQYNQSVLAEVDLTSGMKIREHALEGSVFGEGITILNDTIYQITYKSELCYVYDMNFKLIKTFTYTGEGWGLCNDGKYLMMSNGSDEIVWRDPNTFVEVKKITVYDNESNVDMLNELELINGRLFANLYTDTRLVEIDTATGKVLSYIDCTTLMLDSKEPGNDVLNGIAYHPETKKIYLTGKWWSKLYEVRFN
jgi:glutamine cyclotransferase